MTLRRAKGSVLGSIGRQFVEHQRKARQRTFAELDVGPAKRRVSTRPAVPVIGA
jgi:hypothetical protein